MMIVYENILNNTLYIADGTSYNGEFKDGLRHGKGEQRFVPSTHIDNNWDLVYRADKYVGDWQDNYMEGVGVLTMYFKDPKGKQQVTAVFSNSALVRVIDKSYSK